MTTCSLDQLLATKLLFPSQKDWASKPKRLKLHVPYIKEQNRASSSSKPQVLGMAKESGVASHRNYNLFKLKFLFASSI